MAGHVLIVDDEADIRDGVSLWLSSSGFTTATAGDGNECMHSAEVKLPDCILLDVLMPRKDGMQTLKELKSRPLMAHIPVIMLSASLRDEQRALDAGAKYFIHKPYSGKHLLTAVRAALS